MMTSKHFSKSTFFLVASLFILFLAIPMASHAQTVETLDVSELIQPVSERTLKNLSNKIDVNVKLENGRSAIIWVSKYTNGKFAFSCCETRDPRNTHSVVVNSAANYPKDERPAKSVQGKTHTFTAFGTTWEAVIK